MMNPIIEKSAPKRQSPVTYNDMKGDIVNLCINRWPCIDFDNIIDSFKSELNYQMNSFDNDTDRLTFLRRLLIELETHHKIWEVHGYWQNPKSGDGQYLSATIKAVIVQEYIFDWEDKLQKEKEKVPGKPSFAPEHIPTIHQLLKDFFAPEEQDQLLEIITNGSKLQQPLLFKHNGNRLADAFKQLIKGDIITGCQQKELEQWILGNFKYQYRGEEKSFTSRYLNDVISTNKEMCQNPIIDVMKNPIRIIKA
jgi:hypothetical protein